MTNVLVFIAGAIIISFCESRLAVALGGILMGLAIS
jgi:hypothetical protein